MVRQRPTSCPALRFSAETVENKFVTAYAHDRDGKRWGMVEAVRKNFNDDFFVGMAKVEDAVQGCGVGTRLYETLKREVCRKLKGVLISDITRTTASEMFWRKQVAKGRAECAVPGRGYRAEYIDGKIVTPLRQKYWPCARYALDCAARSLAGARR